MKTEILEELWAAKDKIAKESGYDMNRLFDRLIAAQKKSKRRVVSRTHLREKLATAH